MNRADLGRRGEARAARHVRRHGLRIIARNWRCPDGELDILARDGDLLVVIEVRTARTDFAGGPIATVGPDKRRRLAHLAQRWLSGSRWAPAGVRFDVVGVVYRGWFRWRLDWVRGAFEV
ncbi:MAG: YraN family protein [Deltaproteobacteria bacterium]|nr:YraN family protein [Deltaproteobacteria bacterium]MCB9786771.1 YraN family protein [Deltaproteobacteria bacterium]